MSGDHQDQEEDHAHGHAAERHDCADGVGAIQALSCIEHVGTRSPTAEQRHQAHARCGNEHEDSAHFAIHLIILGAIPLARSVDFVCHWYLLKKPVTFTSASNSPNFASVQTRSCLS